MKKCALFMKKVHTFYEKCAHFLRKKCAYFGAFSYVFPLGFLFFGLRSYQKLQSYIQGRIKLYILYKETILIKLFLKKLKRIKDNCHHSFAIFPLDFPKNKNDI